MAMKILAGAVKIPGYVNRVAYDSTLNVSYGYWICNVCTKSFFGPDQKHKSDCSLEGRTKVIFDENLTYVLGPNESGNFSPFQKQDIEKIKALAKAADDSHTTRSKS